MIHRHSLRVLATDLAASLALVALDAAGRIIDRRHPAPTPAPPAVASLPRQRRPLPFVTFSEDEREAMIRARACQLAGFKPSPSDMETIAVIVLRADLAEWEATA